MDKIDVFVWINGEDGAGAAQAVKGLKAKLKATVGHWFLLGVKSDRLETIAHTVGCKALGRPPTLGGLGALALTNGTSPGLLFWSAEAVLVNDWSPWSGSQAQVWAACPAALWKRTDLPGTGEAADWAALQKQGSCAPTELPAGKVKFLESAAFEKAAKGSWPFGPSVVILKK